MDPASPRQERERINTNLGLDQPLLVRYGNWLREIAAGHLGYSYANGKSVNAILAQRLPNTLLLFVLSFTITVVLALAIGLWAGIHPDSRLDRGITVASIVVNGIPSVLVAIGLIFLFSVQLGILPSSGTASLFTGGAADRLRHLVLPGDHHRPQPCGLLCPVYPGGNEGGAEQLLRDGGSGQPGLQKGSLLGGHEKRPGPLCQLRRHPCALLFLRLCGGGNRVCLPGAGEYDRWVHPGEGLPGAHGRHPAHRLVVILSMLAVDLIDLALNPKLRKSVTG